MRFSLEHCSERRLALIISLAPQSPVANDLSEVFINELPVGVGGPTCPAAISAQSFPANGSPGAKTNEIRR